MIPYRKTALAAVLCASLFAAAPLLADDDTSNAALLRLIQQQAQQIKALEKRLAAVEAEKSAPAAAVAAAPAPQEAAEAQVRNAVADTQQSQIDTLQAQVAQMAAGGGGGGGIDWSGGTPTFRSPDGFFAFQPDLRLMFDASSTHGSAYQDRNLTGTEGRELRLGGNGKVGPFGYRLDVDFQGETVSVKDAWMSYNTHAFGLPVDFYLGNHLKDRAIESSSELDNLPFMERGAVASVLESVNGYYGLGPFVKIYGSNWHLGASITGDQLNNDGAANDSIAYNVRGHWNPLKWDGGFVHLGSWYYYQKIARDVASVNNTPTIATDFNANLQVSSGSIADPHRDQGYGYELAGVYRSFWTYNEYGRRRIQDDSGNVYDHKATSLAAGWLITGEKPGFDQKRANWRDTLVLSPVTGGGLGAWELAFRYDRFDFGDVAKGSVAHSYTYGVNWYLTDWSRLMLEYIDWTTGNRVGAFPGPDSGNTIGLRAQLIF